MRAALSRVAATLVAFGLIAALFITPASASNLALSSRANTFSTSQASCTTNILAVTSPTTGSSAAITISNYPASCNNKSVTVRLRDASGGILKSASGPLAATSTTLTGGSSYVVANVKYLDVSVAGWPVRSTWTPPASAGACVPINDAGNVIAGTCTVTSINATDQYGLPGARYANVYITVSSSSTRSRVTFDFSQAPFPGWTPVGIKSANMSPAAGASCSTLPVFSMNTPSWMGTYYFQITETTNGDVCPGP